MTTPIVYEHSPADATSSLAPFLSKYLPHSLTLLRRLQALTRRPSPTAHLFATFPIPLAPLNHASEDASSSPFAIALCDHANPSGIHVYLFSSAELIPDTQPTAVVHAHCLRTLLARFHAVTHVPDLVLVGCTHSATAALLRSLHLTRDDIHGPGGPYARVLFPAAAAVAAPTVSSSHPSHGDLYFDQVRPRDHARIMKHNALVRTPQAMESWRGAVLRLRNHHDAADTMAPASSNDDPGPGDAVAWAFLDEAASVRTLHCESLYRRRGLARAVVAHLVAGAQRDGVFALGCTDDDDTRASSGMGREEWVSASVDRANEASIALFASLGGKVMWDEYWVRVELARCELQHGHQTDT